MIIDGHCHLVGKGWYSDELRAMVFARVPTVLLGLVASIPLVGPCDVYVFAYDCMSLQPRSLS